MQLVEGQVGCGAVENEDGQKGMGRGRKREAGRGGQRSSGAGERWLAGRGAGPRAVRGRRGVSERLAGLRVLGERVRGRAGGSALRHAARVARAARRSRWSQAREAWRRRRSRRRSSRRRGCRRLVWVDRLRDGVGAGARLERRSQGRVRFAGRCDERPGWEADVERTGAELTARLRQSNRGKRGRELAAAFRPQAVAAGWHPGAPRFRCGAGCGRARSGRLTSVAGFDEVLDQGRSRTGPPSTGVRMSA